MVLNNLDDEIYYGERLFEAGRIDEALRIFESALEKNPEDISALNNKAVVLESIGKHHEAKTIFLDILRKDSKNADAVSNLLTVYQVTGNWDAVKTMLEEYGDSLPDAEKIIFQDSLEREKDSDPQASNIKRVDLTFNLPTLSFDLSLLLNMSEYSQRIMWSQISERKSYEEETILFLSNVLERGDSVIDVGGHIGYFSLVSSSLVGEGGSVFTFEPSRSNYLHLLQHIEINERKNINPLNMALGAEVKESEFFINMDNDGGHALWDVGLHNYNEKSRHNPLIKKIQLETIDHVLNDQDLTTCKVIKIDTEGAEYHVLRGSTGMLTLYKIPFIICEINRFGLRQMQTSEAELRAFMQGFGYDTYLFIEGSGKIVKLLPDQYYADNQFVFNVLFSKDEYVNTYKY